MLLFHKQPVAGMVVHVKGEKQEKVALTNGKVTVLLSTGEGVFIIPEKA